MFIKHDTKLYYIDSCSTSKHLYRVHSLIDHSHNKGFELITQDTIGKHMDVIEYILANPNKCFINEEDELNFRKLIKHLLNHGQ